MVRLHTFGGAVLVLTMACSTDLGPCDQESATELVYNRTGQVATKGQALAHDTCGNAVFCHSKAAKGSARFGVPAGLDFDMVPAPSGQTKLLGMASESWDLVRAGHMPPAGEGWKAVGDGEWIASVGREATAPRLPRLSSKGGLAVFRNWLACGAPVIVETSANSGDAAPTLVTGAEVATWTELHTQLFVPNCAQAGCHNEQSAAGGLALDNLCRAADSLRERGACGEVGIAPGSPDDSFVLHKM
ncbi:MAG: hypothetical protein RL385_3420, partial [Pseudomonadota bacterium]